METHATTPMSFTFWLNGYLQGTGDMPTPEQMAVIRDELNAVMGQLAARRLLERADELLAKEEQDKQQKVAAQATSAMLYEQMKIQMEIKNRIQQEEMDKIYADRIRHGAPALGGGHGIGRISGLDPSMFLKANRIIE